MPRSTFCSIHSFIHPFIHAFNNNNRGKQTFPSHFSSPPSPEVLLWCLCGGWGAPQEAPLFRLAPLVCVQGGPVAFSSRGSPGRALLGVSPAAEGARGG